MLLQLIEITIIILLLCYFFFQRKAISDSIKQMEDIERYPEQNRQLKAITADKKLEQLLNKINEIYTARQKERIIYQRSEMRIRQDIENISHDLRTPLTSMLGYIELIKDGATQEEKSEYLDVIQKRAKLLQDLIKDFYEISRIQADDYPLLLDVISVQEVLKENMVAYYHEFDKKKLEVLVELEERPAYIIADRIQYDRILSNLIQNALKYAQERFILKQYVSGNDCVIEFINDNYKIKEDELSLIFDRFFTGDQSRNSQSTGLGLTISKTLVEKMNGAISAKLVEDLFTIELRWPMGRQHREKSHL